MSHRATNRAFTLIELLVVIAIIAILAAILFPVFAQAREKARQATCQSNLKQWGAAFMMYAQDYDETFPDCNIPAVTASGLATSGWVSVVQPYVEKLGNVNDRGKDINDPNNPNGIAKMNKCLTHTADPRAGYSGTGVARASSGGASQSYGMADWSQGASRPLSAFGQPADTVLLGEQFLNFTQMVFYPVSWDGNSVGTTAQGYADSGDCRFDKNVTCSIGGATYPARTDIMPGVTGTWASNLAPRHATGSNYLFVDGHVKYMKPSQTFKADGSMSMWTLSGKWFRKP